MTVTIEEASVEVATVAALRRMADEVIDAELARLARRLSDLDDRCLAEVAHTVRQVVDAVLCAPMVRVRESCAAPGGVTYAAALCELFVLDPFGPSGPSGAR